MAGTYSMFDLELGVTMMLFAAAVVAGGLNAVAGGASFFTFPALLLAGLPPLTANATNFVALMPSNIAALPAFRKELHSFGKILVLPLLTAALGALVGALLLMMLGGHFFASAVPYLMAFATALFAVAPSLRRVSETQRQYRSTARPKLLTPLLFLFVVSIYGGYFGAGLGQIVMAALILQGQKSFHLANAGKNAIISVISLISVGVYGVSGAISLPHAVIMMLGASIGGYYGGAFSKYVPEKVLRLVVISFGATLTLAYFIYQPG